ncbi:MAG TPA: Spy/CpxP family protein refolding chaperone, partial [Vicinamibacteria bacterium]
MTDSNEDTKRDEEKERRRSRHGFWTGILAGGVLGVALAGAVALGGKSVLAAHFSPGFGGHLGRGLFRQDPELARGHLELMTDWILSRVDATDDQKEQVKRVVSRTYDDLQPLIQEHRSTHETFVSEMTKAELDPEAIERLRASQVELFDRASREVSESLTEIAGLLTPEQRVELVE